MSGPRIGSLCSGYEGLGAAVQSVIGGELAWVADNDPDASRLLAHRFPGVPNLGDIKSVDWLSAGAVDVLCGGYPCQPFSQAGRRLGAADERHIWPYVATAIDLLRPGQVVLENVQGHLTLGFDIVLADLAALDYDAEWMVVTASAAGACHRRARLFIVARPAGLPVVTGAPVAVIRDGEWFEPRESLFGVLPFAGRIPASGRMTSGLVYEAENVPTVMTAGLLKTPTAQLAVNGGSQHPDKRRAGGHGPTLADQVEHELLPTPMTGYSQRTPAQWREGRPAGNGAIRERIGDLAIVAGQLLPTPTAADGDRTSATYPRGDATLIGALLPTPRATDGTNGGPNQRGSSGDLMLPSAVMQLLPTPSVADGTGGHKTRSGDRKDEPLLGGISMLLPTPSAGNFNDGEDLASWEARRQRNLAKGVNGNGQGTPLPVAVQQLAGAVDWGPYEGAIRRWEAVTGRPAPRPTAPGKTAERLNPALPEWMMGLPAGWITEVPGLSRNAQLKIAGNGVVPQQAELALRLLLARTFPVPAELGGAA